MPTNAIGAGNRLTTICGPRDVITDAMKLAYVEGYPSFNAMVKEWLAERVAEAYRTGRLIDRTAQRSLEIAGVFVAFLGVAAVTITALAGENDTRTARVRRVSRRRDEVCEVADALA